MGWEEFTHSCGHAGEFQAYGKMSDRERLVHQKEQTPCPSCRAKVAGEDAEKAGLPKLIGSDKQVAWASSIREKVMEEVPPLLAVVEKAIADGLTVREGQATPEEVRKDILDISEERRASWWIDHRGNGLRALLTQRALARRQ